MKAVVLERFGEKPKLTDVNEPLEKQGWIKLRVLRSALCYRDLLTIKGAFPRAKLPLILGHEFTGEVVEDHPEYNLKKGDKVFTLPYTYCGQCEYCLTGRENLCRSREWYGEHLNGSHAEYILVKPESLIKIDGEVDLNFASIASCVIGMVINGIEEAGGIEEGDKVLVTGASGGVGIHALQIAKAFGAYTIAYTRSEEKAKFIEEMKPDEIIIGDIEFSKEVKKRVGGVDMVIETVGEPTFNQSLRSLKWGGKIVVIGNVNVKPVNLQLGLVILRQNSICGTLSSTKKSLYKAIHLYKMGKLRAVGREVPLEKFDEAVEAMENGESRGRFFLKP